MDVEFLKYQYQDGYDGVITKNRFKIGIRHIQMLYMISCSVVMGAVRGSTGIAVLAMTNKSMRNDTHVQPQHWDRRVEGMVLSSFFFGYAVMFIPAALYLRRVGGKLVLTSMLVIQGVLCVAMPTIVNRGGWVAVCNAQMLMGAAQATLSPANQSLLDKWLLPSERGFFSCLVYGGIQLGIVIGLPICGMISEAKLGWELVYYSLAMLTLSMAAIFGLLTASSPENHQAVGDSEKEYIREALKSYSKRKLKKPWNEILRSPQFWAVTCAHAASNAVFIFYLVNMPDYLMTFGLSLRQSSLLSILPFILMVLIYVTTAPTLNWLYKIGFINYLFNVTYFRKIINTIGASGIAIVLMVLPNLAPEWSNVGVVVSALTLGLAGFQFSGYLRNLKDMSENFPGTLLMMSSSIASLIGAVVPVTTSLLLGGDMDSTRDWRPVFMTLASFYVACNLVYIALGSNERQYWDFVGVGQKFGYHNGMLNTTQLELEEYSYSKLAQKKYENDTEI